MYLEDLGDKIRERRKRLGISQQELAEAAGYTSKVAICRIESGKMNLTMDKLVAIAKYLDMPVSELMHADEPDRTLPPGGFHGGNTRPDLIPVIENLKELDPSDVARVKQYIEILRSAKLWQRLNGTEKGGDFESALTEASAHSQALFLDEEDEKMWNAAQEKADGSLSSSLSGQRGADTSKKSKP